MQLEKLTLVDVGTFGGENSFNLTPKVRRGKRRPIVLFGGLNGAGKTTFLSAIRLALYGRNSLESGSSQGSYERYLGDLIHRSVDKLSAAKSASISLDFTYARLGERLAYRVVRSWENKGARVIEALRLFKDGQAMEELTSEQAQAFLNQLIPAGISQFFFFDGEKISSLARDDSDAVLNDAIHRLLGLDLADRLSSDLVGYSRLRRAKSADTSTLAQIAEIEAELAAHSLEGDASMHKLMSQVTPELTKAKADYERASTALMDRGGAWAVNRDELEKQLEKLLQDRKELEEKLREQLSGIAVFSLAPTLSVEVVRKLELSQIESDRRAAASAIVAKLGDLKEQLSQLENLKAKNRSVNECIDAWARTFVPGHESPASSSLGMSDAEAKSIITSLGNVVPVATHEVQSTCAAAVRLMKEEAEIQDRLAYAPTDSSIAGALAQLRESATLVATKTVERNQLVEELRRGLWAQIELTRKLKKLEAAVNVETTHHRSDGVVESLQYVLEEFKNQVARKKCETLRKHFVAAFNRLARKSDAVQDAKIHYEDFRVSLLNAAGQEIPKNQLSAGEKQIYAISMLEALGKTSGRSLPVIIDTPLGRLDSQHRQKLVESYFSVASHQVIVLSTDTEIDPSFYNGLQKNISHSYHLTFDEKAGKTRVHDGYFWKQDELEETLRAA